MGYLVNHPAGLSGDQGIGYDYVLGAGGVYVQSQNAHLTARVLVAQGPARGLAPVAKRVELSHGPILGRLFTAGLRWFQAARTPSGSSPCAGMGPPTGWPSPRRPGRPAAEVHSHGRAHAFFSATDDADEQGLRIYGVAGRLGTPLPELRLRIGVYGHFAPVTLAHVFSGPVPGLQLAGERTGPRRPARARRRSR